MRQLITRFSKEIKLGIVYVAVTSTLGIGYKKIYNEGKPLTKYQVIAGTVIGPLFLPGCVVVFWGSVLAIFMR